MTVFKTAINYVDTGQLIECLYICLIHSSRNPDFFLYTYTAFYRNLKILVFDSCASELPFLFGNLDSSLMNIAGFSILIPCV